MVISTEGLSFNFGNQQVVKSLSLQVPEGSIYGFLGPNGAGKTTTIKLLLNLLKTEEGSIHVFNQELKSNRISILSQIGSLIEQPAIYLHLSGKENLMNRALLLQVPEQRVDEMLAAQRPEPVLPADAREDGAVVKGGLSIQVELGSPPSRSTILELGPERVKVVASTLCAEG